ncbi:STAS domain-containing protein [Streptomyces chartreusis]
MEITATAGPGPRQAVVTLHGELDIHTARDVRETLIATVAVYEDTVADLTGLDFCDGAGIGVLVATRNAARRHGHHLHVRNIPGYLQLLLRATHTHLADTSPSPPDRAHIGVPENTDAATPTCEPPPGQL